MKEQRARPIYRIAEPIKNLAQRFVYLGLVAAAFALMLLGKADVVLMERFRTHVTDAMAPILEIVSRPADSIASVVGQVRELTRIRAENERLRADRERLVHWQTVARHFEAENKALREMLQFVPGPSVGFITARVIADAGGAFAHSLILSAGSHQGVRKGQAVITGNGLVGRIIGVGSRSARVLLITDLNSRIPVLVEHSRTRAILSGDNSDNPRLILLPPGETVSPGDRIVTSGHGGAFPPGLPVGIITNAGDGSNAVRIFIKRQQLEYVRVIDIGPPAALPSQSEAEGLTDRAAGPGEGEQAAVKPSAQ
ncbi:MAG: rod shape-determining protein MreC [Rhodospirillales bacterium]